MSEASDARIRKAGPEDAQAVRRLVREAYAKWVPLLGREPLPMRADYDRAVREHDVDLLYVGERLAALIETVAKADHLFIENVAVAPSHQGRGLGRQLMRHAEEKAGKADLPKLCLLTNGAFEANIRFYASLGFRTDRTELFLGGTTVYMSKAIEDGDR